MGTIFLLCTIAFAVKSAIPFDLLFVAAVGLFLSARFQMRGCCYALVLLGVAGALKHAFFIDDHLWHLGIEGSLASAFFITALSFEQGAAWIGSLRSQMEARTAAVENLEEELLKEQQSAQEQQIAFQERVALLQKEFDELQAEHSSILILNEVLRKTVARQVREKGGSIDAQPIRETDQETVHKLKQLKVQFEEKNQVLHQVRSDLFKSDTEVQQLRMEKKAFELSPLPKEVEREMESLGAQLVYLEDENRELEELVTVLSDPMKRKKKVKTALASSDQNLLFELS